MNEDYRVEGQSRPIETRDRLDSSQTEYRGQFGRSDHYARLGDWGNPTVTAAAAVVSELASDSVPVMVGVGVAAEVAQRYKHLTRHERAVFDLLRRLAQGGSIYKVWIDEEELLDAMNPEFSIDARRRLLATMTTRGLLEEGAGQWRAVW